MYVQGWVFGGRELKFALGTDEVKTCGDLRFLEHFDFMQINFLYVYALLQNNKNV